MKKLIFLSLFATSQSYALDVVLKKGLEFSRPNCGYDECYIREPVQFQSDDINCHLDPPTSVPQPAINESFQVIQTTVISFQHFQTFNDYTDTEKCLERNSKGFCIHKEIITLIRPGFFFYGSGLSIQCIASEKIAREIKNFDKDTAETFLKQTTHPLIRFP